MKKIIVTGGLGFIGSNLIGLLLKKNYSVINIDKVSYSSSFYNVKEFKNSKNYKFIKCDIKDKELKKIILKYKPNIIFNLAAETHVDRSIDNPKNFIDSNILGVYNLLECFRDFSKKNRTKLIHISTDEVYGDVLKGRTSENYPYNPSSPYAASKAASDHLVSSYVKTYKIPAIITNCSNNYGPWQNPEKLIPKTIMNALTENHIPIYGKGINIRDWLHVTDHANALIQVSKTTQNFIKYNIGANQEMTNIDLVKLICNYLDEKMPGTSSHLDLITYVEDRLGHDLRYAVNASKLAFDFNYQPNFLLPEGIINTIDWYIDNLEWVKSKATN